jgi:ankyrin repeat protein
LGYHDIVEYLLNQGADPTITSKKNMTPYDLANDKETRNIFRRYMAEHMDKWNWNVARVPSPLTKEMEEEQQNRQKEKKKKNKEKKKKIAANKKEKESEKTIVTESIESKSESSTSKKLTSGKTLDSSSSLIGLPPEMRMKIERERRARAAEARLQSTPLNLPSIGNVVCTTCGKSLSELVPFEVSELKFCSVKCVKSYRESNIIE